MTHTVLLTEKQIIEHLSDETIDTIKTSEVCPAGYNTPDFDDAYSEVFGGDVVSDEQEETFKTAINKIWRDNIN